MSESMITRCPKCSTTFRVTQEVLSMAKGKVRCGQCFHIFTAQPASNSDQASAAPASKVAAKPIQQKSTQLENKATPQKEEVQQAASSTANISSQPEPESQPKSQSASTSPKTPVSPDGTVNPEWLNTLFHEEDLEPYTPPKSTSDRFMDKMHHDDENESSDLFGDFQPEPVKTRSENRTPPKQKAKTQVTPKPQGKHAEELAPWEMELAELEAQFSADSPESEPLFSGELAKKAPPTKQAKQPTTSKPQTPPPVSQTYDAPVSNEPDYMQALHSLAQDVSKQDTMSDSEYSSQESMKQLAAQYSLATLTDTEKAKPKRKKSKHGWLWSIGSFLTFLLLIIQISIGFFDQGSRSPEFRGFYKAACSYLGCTLPSFEDISAIEIEHIRIQSHPSLSNTLQVNAIMTNISSFAQSMPKLALEFYDLNGRPVAARLFAPQDYLHKDFLDITFMPPSTPIHIVIPIQDPGARAVTHQIKVYSNETQSY